MISNQNSIFSSGFRNHSQVYRKSRNDLSGSSKLFKDIKVLLCPVASRIDTSRSMSYLRVRSPPKFQSGTSWTAETF